MGGAAQHTHRQAKELEWQKQLVKSLTERGRLERPVEHVVEHASGCACMHPAPDAPLSHSLEDDSEEPELHHRIGDLEHQIGEVPYGSKEDRLGGREGRTRFLEIVRQSSNKWELGDHGRFVHGKICADKSLAAILAPPSEPGDQSDAEVNPSSPTQSSILGACAALDGCELSRPYVKSWQAHISRGL